jgi:hypothetical protein
MNRRKLTWMVATKVAFTIAVMLPLDPRRAVEYRSLATLSGVGAGTPVTFAGQLIGQVVATSRRGDTTILHVRFNRGAERLPGSRSVALRRMGLGQDVAIEILFGPRRSRESFARGGWLRVRPPVPPPPVDPGVARLLPLPPQQSPSHRLIPLAPIPPPRWAPAST